MIRTLWLSACLCVLLTAKAFALSSEAQTSLVASYSLEARGMIQDAIEKMVSIYKESPSDYLVNLRLGWLFYIQRKYRNSMDHYIRASNAAPDSIEPLLGLSQTELAAEDYIKNFETCKSILKLDPKNYVGQKRLIQSQIKLKHYSSALEALNQVLLNYPTDAVFLEQKGYVLQELGRQAEAISILHSLLLLNPQNAYALYVIGSFRTATTPMPASDK